MKTKICTKCFTEKLLSEFPKQKTGKFGLRANCKKCKPKYKNLIKMALYRKTYKEKNKEKVKIEQKTYYLQNKLKIIKRVVENKKNRLKTDINFKLLKNIRDRIRIAIKRNSKCDSTIKLIGCSIEFLKCYLQSQFKLDMSWSNYGEWHIDHIKPCSSFDLSKPEEQELCFHFTNLQPLWALDNLQKSNKY